MALGVMGDVINGIWKLFCYLLLTTLLKEMNLSPEQSYKKDICAKTKAEKLRCLGLFEPKSLVIKQGPVSLCQCQCQGPFLMVHVYLLQLDLYTVVPAFKDHPFSQNKWS